MAVPEDADLNPTDNFEFTTWKDDQGETFASPFDQTGDWVSQTPSSNPSRPRTLAAGYDPSERIMTVVFRDGTWWNYYNVPQALWNQFRSAGSPGEFMRETPWEDGRTLDTWGDMGAASFSPLGPQMKTFLKQQGLGGSWDQYARVYNPKLARQRGLRLYSR